jgi:rhodanese-related sulfurtransferase
MRHSPGFLKLVDDAKARIKEVSADEVRRGLGAKDQFILIDVREDSEWNRSHLPQAIHLSRGIIERDIEKTVPDADAEIVLYCGGGFRSALAADNLQKMGYRRVASMAGGFREWCEVGYPLEKT